MSLLRDVDGDFRDPATFAALRAALTGAVRPTFYLAIPPILFDTVIRHLSESG